jgi:dihydrofolate synthase/folylpolyglutamate synthase
MSDFFDFLEKKPLYYQEIDHNRIRVAYDILKDKISHPKTIHLIGTNGKGSTGRALAHFAFSAGLKVGHYSSPHILEFNERIWINGQNVTDSTLQNAHKRLFKILGEEMSRALSYFEYTTLLAFIIFENVDLIVLEAGLGGEFDATSVAQNRIFSIITPIGFDHQAFLGESIQEIATTKIKSVKKEALIAPQIYDEVVNVAQKLSKELNFRLHLAKLESRLEQKVEKILSQKAYPEFLVSNIKVAIQALDILGIDFSFEALEDLEIFGRFYKIAPNITVDVGHNLLSAKAIVKELPKDTLLIYNSLQDKDYYEILKSLKPKIKEVEIIPISNQRASNQSELKNSLKKLNIPFKEFTADLKDGENYLVFGSFYTVEAFLRSLRT